MHLASYKKNTRAYKGFDAQSILYFSPEEGIFESVYATEVHRRASLASSLLLLLFDLPHGK
jgi:hypothetical protein